MTGPRARVLVVAPQRLVAQGIALALEGGGFDARLAIGRSADEVLRTDAECPADVALVEVRGDGGVAEDLTLVRGLERQHTAVIVMADGSGEVAFGEYIEAGAVAVTRSNEPLTDLIQKIDTAARGESVTSANERSALLDELRAQRSEQRELLAPFERLTKRESEVLLGLTLGLPAEVIAHRARVTVATVRSQIHAVLTKLDVNSQLGAVAKARQANWNGSAHR